MKCVRCSRENETGAAYCYACGEPFDCQASTAARAVTSRPAESPQAATEQTSTTDGRGAALQDNASIDVVCPSCGAVVSAERKFCTSCGANLRRPSQESQQFSRASNPPRVGPAQPPPEKARALGRGAAEANVLAVVKERVAREAGSSRLSSQTKQPVLSAGPASSFCPRCGQAARQGKSFCFNCGAGLTKPAAAPPATSSKAPAERQTAPSSAPPTRRFCSACGTESTPGKPFCSGCGAKVSDKARAQPTVAVKPAEQPTSANAETPSRPLTEEEQWEVWTREELVKHGKPPLMGYPAKKGQEAAVKLARAAVALASAKLDQESPQSAIAELDRFLVDPRLRPMGLKEFNALALYIRGLANERSANWKAARKDYESALREDKKYDRPHEALARLKAVGR